MKINFLPKIRLDIANEINATNNKDESAIPLYKFLVYIFDIEKI